MTLRGWMVSLPVAVLLAACGGGEKGPPADQLVGTWRATRIEFTGAAGTVELVAEGGSGTLVLEAAGTGVLTLSPAGGSPRVRSGPWSLDGDHLTLGTPANNENWSVSLQGGALRLRGSQTSWDLDGDGTGDPASLNLDFVR